MPEALEAHDLESEVSRLVTSFASNIKARAEPF
jgi:hypothetical protein